MGRVLHRPRSRVQEAMPPGFPSCRDPGISQRHHPVSVQSQEPANGPGEANLFFPPVHGLGEVKLPEELSKELRQNFLRGESPDLFHQDHVAGALDGLLLQGFRSHVMAAGKTQKRRRRPALAVESPVPGRPLDPLHLVRLGGSQAAHQENQAARSAPSLEGTPLQVRLLQQAAGPLFQLSDGRGYKAGGNLLAADLQQEVFIGAHFPAPPSAAGILLPPFGPGIFRHRPGPGCEPARYIPCAR